ncbi:MAG: dephospho-CoA kinase [Pseudomonadota bacterium]|nr:dephospho-CoA kinase [Pseudomonadota bacterium]
MFLVGLTGGIASGKSTVAERFAAHGIDVIDADALAREVVAPGEPALAQLVKEFGDGILTAAGELDRPRVREQAFADDDFRRRLERVTHPAIAMRMQARLRASRSPYTILMVPLLIESGQHRLVQRVLVVDLPPEAQQARLMQRDAVDAGQAGAAIAAQATRERRLALADDIIDNRHPRSVIAAAVDELHEAYLRMAADPQARRQRFVLPRRNPD